MTSARSHRWHLVAIVAILLAAAALRFHDLGSKSLWGDEIAQALRSEGGLEDVVGLLAIQADFLLHFFFDRVFWWIGREDFIVRYPSAGASILLVAATYIAARRLTDRMALVAALLIAVSPYQIWYAQEARRYASLALFAMCSLYLFLRWLDAPGFRPLVGLTIANAILIYTHFFGLFPLVVEFVAAASLALYAILRPRQGGGESGRANALRLPLARLGWFAASLAISLALAFPIIPGTLSFIVRGGQEIGLARPAPLNLTPELLERLAARYGLSMSADWRLWIALALGVIGLIWFARTRPRAGWVAILWIFLPLVVLALARPEHAVADRYLIFIQPVYLILCSAGIVAAWRAGWGWLASQRAERDPGPRLYVPKVIGAVLVALALAALTVPPLDALYRRAKTNDWAAIARYLESNAEPGDIIVSAESSWGMNALAYYLSNLLAYSTPPSGIGAFQQARADNRRLWYVSLGIHLDAKGVEWAQTQLERIPARAWQRTDLDYDPSDEYLFPQSEPPAALFFSPGEIPSRIAYAGKLGFATDGTARVRVNPGETVEAKLRSPVGPSRKLRIEYLGKNTPSFDVSVEGELIAQVRGQRDAEGNRATSETFPLAQDMPEAVIVRITNTSPQFRLFVRAISLIE